MRLVALFLALLTVQFAQAAPFAVQVGDARLALDAPPGFADTQFTGSPRLIDLAEGMTPASNRILLFALEDADLRRFTTGDSLELRRSALVATPRAMERERLTNASFKAFADESMRNEAAATAPKGTLSAYLDAQPPGAASPLGTLRRDDDVVSVLLGTRLPGARPDAPPRYLASSHSLVFLRGKVLDVAVFSRYESAADLEWLRTATARWIDELQRLNSR